MKKANLLLVIISLLFIAVTYFVITNKTVLFDQSIYNFLINYRCSFFDVFFKTITSLANTIAIICLVTILLLIIKDKYRYVLGITIIITVISNAMLKHIIMRHRPLHEHLINQGGYSYPSGHAMISVAVFGFLIYYTYNKINNKPLKILLIILLSFLIIMIGISRVYLGVHYPSYVIGGYLLSLIILIGTIQVRGQKNDKISD